MTNSGNQVQVQVDSSKIKDISNELLAAYRSHQLQRYRHEYQTRLQPQRQSILSQNQQLGATLLNLLYQTIPQYESAASQEITLDTIDLATIYSGVDEQLAKGLHFLDRTPYDYVDCLVKELLRWYKHDFFKWVNKPETTELQGPARLIRVEHANNEERQYGNASRTEVYVTANSNEIIRFPRYNDPVRLLTWRQGRCGEWVNCFLLILRSLNIRARYIWNAEDHVWCEYFSPALKTWVHLDPCEESSDQPGLYCEGWGKEMSYCFAVGFDCGVKDVSEKYITKKEKQLPRSKLSEDDLERLVKFINADYMKDWDFDTRTFNVFVESNYENLLYKMKNDKDGDNEITDLMNGIDLKGRQSGDKEWTKSRGEGGN